MRRPTPYTQYPKGSAKVDGLLGPQWKEDRPTMDVSKERPQVTAGLDLGDNYSYLCLIDSQSGDPREKRICKEGDEMHSVSS